MHTCLERNTGDSYIVKSFPKSAQEEMIRSVIKEVDILRELIGYTNCVQLYRVYEDTDEIHIVMESIKGVNLFEYL